MLVPSGNNKLSLSDVLRLSRSMNCANQLTNGPFKELALREAYETPDGCAQLSYSEAEGQTIGECKDASQSLPPSHQRLTERIVGVTVHATVLFPRLSL